MRVVNVCRRFDAAHWGGTETVVAETGTRLRARGHEVSVLASAALSEPGAERVRGLDVERFAYGYPYLRLDAEARAALDNAGGNLISWPLLGRLLTMPRPDVVHLHTAGRLGGMVRWACRARGIPYVVSLHGGRFTIPPSQQAVFRRPLDGAVDLGKPLGLLFGARRVLRDAAAVLAFNRAEVAACRRELPGVRVVHTPHGLDLARWLAPVALGASPFRPGAWPKLLCVGRLDPQKGQDLLVPMVAELRARFPRLQLILIGSPTEPSFAERLARRIRGGGLERTITLLGGLAPDDPALRAAFRDASCLLVPSRHEPFGIVALEGWASETPVIAANTGGLSDLLAGDVAGTLVEPEQPAALAAAVRSLLDDPARARRMRAAGRARVEVEHDWERVVDRLEDLLLGAGRAQAWARSATCA